MGASVDFNRSNGRRRCGHLERFAYIAYTTVSVLGFAMIGCASSKTSSPPSAGTVAVSASTEASSATAAMTSAATTVAPTTSSPATSAPATVAPTTSASTAGTEPPTAGALARVWFVQNERLSPAYRSAAGPEETLRDLLAGPASSDPSELTTAIPAGAALLGVRIVGDLATVDLDRRFESGGGALSMTARVAQIVYTVTEFPGVARVAFALDGAPAVSIGGEGIDVSTPVGRDDFGGVKPLIFATEPRPGQAVTSPLRIVGENSTSENNVEISLRTSDGRVLLETFATGTGPILDDGGQPAWGPFETSVDFYAGSATSGELALTETSSDGSGRLIADFSIPVTFTASAVEPPPPLDGASIDAVTVPETGCCDAGPFVLLTGVTAQRLAGLDRIVFEFSAPVVNYHVRYVPLPVTEDPSDLPVVLQGDSALQLSMGATGVDQTVSPPVQTYTGAGRIAVGTGSVIELVQSGDFEAVSNWTIGVRGRPPFRVSTESDPAQLVIDIASP